MSLTKLQTYRAYNLYQIDVIKALRTPVKERRAGAEERQQPKITKPVSLSGANFCTTGDGRLPPRGPPGLFGTNIIKWIRITIITTINVK